MIDTRGARRRATAPAPTRVTFPTRTPMWSRALVDQGAIVVGRDDDPRACVGRHDFERGVRRHPESAGHEPHARRLQRGGAAAAIAAGAVAAGLGTDTGGSVRIPAALCGVAGFAADAGRAVHRGASLLALDAVIIRASLGKALMTSRCSRASRRHRHPRARRMAVGAAGRCLPTCRRSRPTRRYSPASRACGPHAAHAFHPGPRRPRKTCSTASMATPSRPSSLTEEAASNISRRSDEARIAAHYSEETRRRLGLARGGEPARLMRGHSRRGTASRIGSRQRWPSWDYLLVPTCACLPPTLDASAVSIGAWSGTVRHALMTYTAPFNVAGFPAISIPLWSTGCSLPAAMQIVAHPGDDGALLKIAAEIERIVHADPGPASQPASSPAAEGALHP
ncbi:amidase family protein [Cupriavidus basilensis]